LLVATLVACVLLRYYPHHHHLASGELVVHHVVVHILLLGTHHCHFTLFGVVASLLLLGLMLGYYVDCAMVRYYPLPLPCVGGGIPLQ